MSARKFILLCEEAARKADAYGQRKIDRVRRDQFFAAVSAITAWGYV